MSGANGRRPRKAFFSPALQSEYKGIWISKNTGNPTLNPEAGKLIDVP
jgi:hypothetical protein